jgi:hypothetical protein
MRRMPLRLAVLLTLLLPATACIRVTSSRGAAEEGSGAASSLRKGGDDRSGPYDIVEAWWKPAPDHDSIWTWGSVSGVAADTPNRIIVAVWGDQRRTGTGERPNSSNYLLVVDRNGKIVENWSQWDSLFNRPHQVYISPYDPNRDVWVVERGGNGVHEQILKFSNDGKRLLMRLTDPAPVMSKAQQRQIRNPGAYDFGQPAVIAFLPNGDWLLGDGYDNARIARYSSDGKLISQFGSVGTGPGQFDLVHGVAVDRNKRIYVSDRMNHRIQIFTESGEYIEEWPEIWDPVAIMIDENQSVWVLDATLNRILKYDTEGHLLDYFGAYGKASSLGRPGYMCSTTPAACGGMALPHQMDIDSEGNLYIAEFSGPWMDKLTPKAGADRSRLIGQPLKIPR